jgi:hypothetical protein
MEQAHFHGIDRVSGKRAVSHRAFKTFLNRLNEFAGDNTTYDIVHKFQSFLVTFL